MRTVEDFKREAESIYDRSRDMGKPFAILEIAQGLVNAYCDGAAMMVDDVKGKIELVKATSVTEA